MPSVQFPFAEDLSWEQWINRYPFLCHGQEEWRKQSLQNDLWNPPILPRPLELPQRVSIPTIGPPRPRVFVSHRQGDEIYAKRIAYLADRAGFEYWLDVVNLPPPAAIATMSAITVALRIEMALLNCSHIVAVYTDITPGSTWVPYEYGRIKEPVLSSTKCCTWLYIQNANTIMPEWLELNEQREREQPLVLWFEAELKKWSGNLSQPVGDWAGKTSPLP